MLVSSFLSANLNIELLKIEIKKKLQQICTRGFECLDKLPITFSIPSQDDLQWRMYIDKFRTPLHFYEVFRKLAEY